MQGQWSDVVGMARWSSFASHFSPGFQARLSWQPSHEMLETGEPLCPDKLSGIANEAKHWAAFPGSKGAENLDMVD